MAAPTAAPTQRAPPPPHASPRAACMTCSCVPTASGQRCGWTTSSRAAPAMAAARSFRKPTGPNCGCSCWRRRLRSCMDRTSHCVRGPPHADPRTFDPTGTQVAPRAYVQGLGRVCVPTHPVCAHHLTTSPPHHLTTSPPHHLTTRVRRFCFEALTDLTGAPTLYKRFGGDDEPTFDELLRHDANRFLICCSTPGQDTISEGARPASAAGGLVPGHAYTLIEVRRLQRGRYRGAELLKLRKYAAPPNGKEARPQPHAPTRLRPSSLAARPRRDRTHCSCARF